jgi:hypothetical protein
MGILVGTIILSCVMISLMCTILSFLDVLNCSLCIVVCLLLYGGELCRHSHIRKYKHNTKVIYISFVWMLYPTTNSTDNSSSSSELATKVEAVHQLSRR